MRSRLPPRSSTLPTMALAPTLLLLLSALLAFHPNPASAIRTNHPSKDARSTDTLESISNQARLDAYTYESQVRRQLWASQPRAAPLPSKRSYDTHHYYAVELHPKRSPGVDPRDVAESLGAELVERVGELEHHWLIRSEKPLADASPRGAALDSRSRPSAAAIQRRDVPEEHDEVLKRWESIKSKRNQPGFTTSHRLSKRQHVAALSIKAVERQSLRLRHKRNVIYDPLEMPELYPEVRAPLPGPLPIPEPRPPPIPDAKTAAMISAFGISDPIFPDQWHLANERKLGYDLNVSDVWKAEVTGKGVNVALIDDGLDMHSPDLKDNFFAGGSYDFNAHTALPEPRESDDQHGTRCAGEIAAVKNDVCGVGVAYEAHVSGIRILSGPITDVDEAAALNYAYQENHVYSCSWGPPDDGRSMDAPKGLIAKAMLNGVQNGRDGKGSIFVFAGGNGGASDDQCNFDGYTNSIYSMTIAAVDREGLHPYYSEMCSANLATGWSSGSGDHIHTTDVAWNGVNRCTTHHGGTSAAAPLVAGVVALALQVRPDLTWRDMQHIAVHSAIMINPSDKDWQKTQAGRHYNHKYGYGLIDAYQFVEEARRHKLVTPQAWYESPNVTIPSTDTFISAAGSTSSYKITQDMLTKANVDKLEHVTVRVWITHQRRGDVNVELVSPHGTKSVLARARRYDDATTGFPGWSFMTLKHWDESPIGEWKVRVFDEAHPEKTGNFYAWSMTLWGSSIDPSKAVAWNFPEDSVEYHETLAAAPNTTIIKYPATMTGAGGTKTLTKPTQHLPVDHGSAPGESHVDFTDGTQPAAAGGSGSQPQQQPKPEADTGYISGLKKNSTWVMVAGGLVIIFAGSLAAFFIMRKRKRRLSGGASGREGDYEFVPEDDDDDHHHHNLAMGSLERGGRGAGRGKGRGGRRTKELYDAFGDASEGEEDEEDELVGPRGVGFRGGKEMGLDSAYRDVYEDEDEDRRFAITDEDEAKPPPPRYRDEEEGEDENEKSKLEKGKGRGKEEVRPRSEPEGLKDDESGSGGSGASSWQDAAV
ncbi:hypothetical protein IE53DRAFT_379599 [Violaceomyces palustris]|uniref:Uncharacterized protein n=1 Tax=Violaceomyces palustris TaxID=1673888 RepID=A0ACD0NXX3_9BASI|nr:hypothetical protein IE53DRAFT_379599 [Violaceomyces palustris]